jgi:osmotically inducible protein OsmC
MKRNATAVWHGDGKNGNGTITSQSGRLHNQPYSFDSRFKEEGKTTNPEELIAAAHAGCFTMALSFMLTEAGFKPDELKTEASVEIESSNGTYSLTGIELNLCAKISDITPAQFQTIAENAKALCPVSKALSSVPVTLKADLL